jgi:hypothetical protein
MAVPTWVPSIGGGGDDDYNVPGATKIDGSVDTSADPSLIQTTPEIADPLDPWYERGGLPAAPFDDMQLAALDNFNQLWGFANQLLWNYVVANGHTITNVETVDGVGFLAGYRLFKYECAAHGIGGGNPGPIWKANQVYGYNQIVCPTIPNGYSYQNYLSNYGQSDATEPTWPTGSGSSVWDKDNRWYRSSGTVVYSGTGIMVCGVDGPAHCNRNNEAGKYDTNHFIIQTNDTPAAGNQAYNSGGAWLPLAVPTTAGMYWPIPLSRATRPSAAGINFQQAQVNLLRAFLARSAYTFTTKTTANLIKGADLANLRKALST